MREGLREIVLTLVGTAMLSTLALTLAPEGKVKKAVRLICGLVMVLSVVGALKRLDFSGYSQELTKWRMQSDSLTDTIEGVNNELERTIIEEKCEAYILDKASGLDISIEKVSVLADWDTEGYWYPVSVELKSDGVPTNRQKLEYHIEAELGISEEKIIWSTLDEEQ